MFVIRANNWQSVATRFSRFVLQRGRHLTEFSFFVSPQCIMQGNWVAGTHAYYSNLCTTHHTQNRREWIGMSKWFTEAESPSVCAPLRDAASCLGRKVLCRNCCGFGYEGATGSPPSHVHIELLQAQSSKCTSWHRSPASFPKDPFGGWNGNAGTWASACAPTPSRAGDARRDEPVDGIGPEMIDSERTRRNCEGRGQGSEIRRLSRRKSCGQRNCGEETAAHENAVKQR